MYYCKGRLPWRPYRVIVLVSSEKKPSLYCLLLPQVAFRERSLAWDWGEGWLFLQATYWCLWFFNDKEWISFILVSLGLALELWQSWQDGKIVRYKYLSLRHTKPWESFLRLCMGQQELLEVQDFSFLSCFGLYVQQKVKIWYKNDHAALLAWKYHCMGYYDHSCLVQWLMKQIMIKLPAIASKKWKHDTRMTMQHF